VGSLFVHARVFGQECCQQREGVAVECPARDRLGREPLRKTRFAHLSGRSQL
jgi:hypothetical protein